MSTYSDYVDRVSGTTMSWLGQVVWYSVTEDTKVDLRDITKTLRINNLERFIPPPPKDVDVFRRVCTKAQKKRVPVTDEVHENYLVRDVRSASGHYWKQIVVERVDSSTNRRLDFTPVIELEFDPQKQDVTTSLISGTNFHQGAQRIAYDITTNYQDWRGNLHAYVIRELIREIVLSTGATILKPTGGVYFVMHSQAQVLVNLEATLTTINGATLATLPLIDDTKQKELVRAAIEEETVGEIAKINIEITELLDGDPINSKRFVKMASRINAIKGRTGEYAELLDTTLDTTHLHMRALESNMQRLYRHQG